MSTPLKSAGSLSKQTRSNPKITLTQKNTRSTVLTKEKTQSRLQTLRFLCGNDIKLLLAGKHHSHQFNKLTSHLKFEPAALCKAGN
ncbi:MAG: hypothetical protein EA409_13945 [Saprospirales bacterium]|nr:MAG: hypothetical protein EA409_13945 [Saprospirales bacterium]